MTGAVATVADAVDSGGEVGRAQPGRGLANGVQQVVDEARAAYIADDWLVARRFRAGRQNGGRRPEASASPRSSFASSRARGAGNRHRLGP